MLVLKRGFYCFILIGNIIVFSGLKSWAQIGWEAGLWLGAGHYFGDLIPNITLRNQVKLLS